MSFFMTKAEECFSRWFTNPTTVGSPSLAKFGAVAILRKDRVYTLALFNKCLGFIDLVVDIVAEEGLAW